MFKTGMTTGNFWRVVNQILSNLKKTLNKKKDDHNENA